MGDADGVAGPVALDATPLLGPVTGIGRYVGHLVDELATGPGAASLGLVTVSVRRGARGATAPTGPWRRSLRVPARLWRRTLPQGSAAVDVALRPARLWHMTNFVAPRPRRTPYVMTVHDLAYLHLPAHVTPGAAALRHLVPLALRGAAAVVTVSAATRDDLLEAYPWLQADVVPVPLGVDAAWFVADGPQGAADGDPGRRGADHRAGGPGTRGDGAGHVLAVGVREPRKNLGMLVRAHRRAREDDPSVPRLLLLGGRGWGEDLDGASVDGRHVRLVEGADDATLRHLLRTARALCAPSLREGFSLPVLEAMAAGTPVLASDIPAHRELLGGTGTLLPAAEEDAWAHALGSLTGSGVPPVGPARLRARTYTWRRTADAHAALWSTVLSGASP